MRQLGGMGSGPVSLEVLNEAPAETKRHLTRLKLCPYSEDRRPTWPERNQSMFIYVIIFINYNVGGRPPGGYLPRNPNSGVRILCIS
jgi:hypothetical protein